MALTMNTVQAAPTRQLAVISQGTRRRASADARCLVGITLNSLIPRQPRPGSGVRHACAAAARDLVLMPTLSSSLS